MRITFGLYVDVCEIDGVCMRGPCCVVAGAVVVALVCVPRRPSRRWPTATTGGGRVGRRRAWARARPGRSASSRTPSASRRRASCRSSGTTGATTLRFPAPPSAPSQTLRLTLSERFACTYLLNGDWRARPFCVFRSISILGTSPCVVQTPAWIICVFFSVKRSSSLQVIHKPYDSSKRVNFFYVTTAGWKLIRWRIF